MNRSTAVNDPTKTRLLEAAGEEFAAKGFESARVRTICERAEANVAAVNYHFGDKEQLYIAAVLEAHRCGNKAFPESAVGTPSEELRSYIAHFLGNVLAMDRGESWHHTLMLREMIRPTEASETLVREAIRPRFERLQSILRRVCPEADRDHLNALSFSVIGQCLHYRLARPITERLVGPEAFQALDIEFLTEHITKFCLAALGLAAPFDAAARSNGVGPRVGAVNLARARRESNHVVDRATDAHGRQGEVLRDPDGSHLRRPPDHAAGVDLLRADVPHGRSDL